MIAEYRRQINMSQSEFAAKIGVSRYTVSNWELGKTSPTIKQAKIMSQIFGVGMEYLLGCSTDELLGG